MLVIIFGVDGLVGRRLVGQALGRGHEVTAVSAGGWPVGRADAHLHVVRADVLAPFSFGDVLADQQAVLFALDADGSHAAHSEGMRNVLAAMTAQDRKSVV
jgi:putative NADH-flavin reductase